MKEINELEGLLEMTYKERIKQLGLIETGTLYNSIAVQVTYIDLNLSIELTSVDYFDILDEKYDISNYVMSQQLIVDKIGEIIGNQIVDTITS